VGHKKETRVKKWYIAVVAVVVVAVAVGAFFGGRATAGGGTPTVAEALKVLQNQAQQGNGTGFPGGNGFAGANGAARRGGAVSGSIIAADATSITVKTSDGGTKIVLVSGSTTVSKVSEGTQADLTVGQNVIVTGTANSDGSVSATRVQVGATLPTTGAGAPGADGTGAPPAGAAPGNAGTAPGAAPGAGSSNTTAAQ
jgi:Domain of unknown function (DUF5666)